MTHYPKSMFSIFLSVMSLFITGCWTADVSNSDTYRPIIHQPAHAEYSLTLWQRSNGSAFLESQNFTGPFVGAEKIAQIPAGDPVTIRKVKSNRRIFAFLADPNGPRIFFVVEVTDATEQAHIADVDPHLLVNPSGQPYGPYLHR